jgi:hypothetical protein
MHRCPSCVEGDHTPERLATLHSVAYENDAVLHDANVAGAPLAGRERTHL